MDINEAGLRINTMWKRLGAAFERSAYQCVEESNMLDANAALKFARMAEACFWQATGENDANDLKDVMEEQKA